MIIFVDGLPGSGKSVVIQQLEKAFGNIGLSTEIFEGISKYHLYRTLQSINEGESDFNTKLLSLPLSILRTLQSIEVELELNTNIILVENGPAAYCAYTQPRLKDIEMRNHIMALLGQSIYRLINKFSVPFIQIYTKYDLGECKDLEHQETHNELKLISDTYGEWFAPSKDIKQHIINTNDLSNIDAIVQQWVYTILDDQNKFNSRS